MADEIPNANVIATTCLGPDFWVASIANGMIQASGSTASAAIHGLATFCEDRQYCFDPTWQPPSITTLLTSDLNN